MINIAKNSPVGLANIFQSIVEKTKKTVFLILPRLSLLPLAVSRAEERRAETRTILSGTRRLVLRGRLDPVGRHCLRRSTA